jgi:hypothetical protein
MFDIAIELTLLILVYYESTIYEHIDRSVLLNFSAQILF